MTHSVKRIRNCIRIIKWETKKFKKKGIQHNKNKNKSCYRSRNTDHRKNDSKYPTKDKKCGRCGLIEQFKAFCKTKLHSNFTKMKSKLINAIDK